jgi:CHAT domain-containing protein
LRTSRYQALVLRQDGEAEAVDLGLAAPIDEAATRLHDALGNSDPGVEPAARRLYELAFRPLVPFLKARKIFIVPDGQLALVPFAALHDGTRYLVDAYDFLYLTNGADLLPRAEAERTTSSTVVVLAAPDFGGQAAASGATRAALERTGAWSALPGTEEEARAIQRLVPDATLYLHGEASKARLLGLYPPGVLHVATHGYFLEDSRAGAGANERTMVGLGGAAKLPSTAADPLLRSGLVMSAPSATADMGEYLVSALELSGLNLWGTQLVVLSACDTGRGDVKLGQGVYGLRRALMVAGAETVVASLWKVDDATTRALMERFYRNLLAGQGRAAALQQAMIALRAKHPHPHSWAPFITIGRDAPLRGLTDSRSQP